MTITLPELTRRYFSSKAPYAAPGKQYFHFQNLYGEASLAFSMIRFHKIVGFSLAAFFLVMSVAATFHEADSGHDQAHDHASCTLCIIASAEHSTVPVSEASLPVPLDLTFQIALPDVIFQPFKEVSTAYLALAPPASLHTAFV